MKTRYCWIVVAIVMMLDVRAAEAQCTSQVTPTSVNVSSIGSTSALSVVSGTNCTWTAVSMDPWITVTSASGHGIGQVNYSVAANTTGMSRTGTMVVAGTDRYVHAGRQQLYLFGHANQRERRSDRRAERALRHSGTSCSWTAVSNIPWVTITGGASGSGIGGVNYTVATNTGAARTGTLTVAGKTITFSQAAGASGPPPPPPTNLRIVGTSNH